MYPETIRIGIIGAGGNTRGKHIPGLQALDGIEIITVCNRTLESGQRVADEFNIPLVTENWWEVTRADDLDAIIIGTWPYMHHPITLAALAADKHVMCEARMAMNAQEAHDMLNAAHAKPTPRHTNRTFPLYIVCRCHRQTAHQRGLSRRDFSD